MSQEKSNCGCQGLGDMPLPEITFSTFILSLSSSALVHLGAAPNPEDGSVTVMPHLAKHTIDILAMLKCKTRQCLEEDEAKLLDEVLCQLRLKYVEVMKREQ